MANPYRVRTFTCRVALRGFCLLTSCLHASPSSRLCLAQVKKSPAERLAVRCDSFVVETDVHFPTDINLLYDAVRKAIETSAALCNDNDLSDWRQSAYNVPCLKKAYRCGIM